MEEQRETEGAAGRVDEPLPEPLPGRTPDRPSEPLPGRPSGPDESLARVETAVAPIIQAESVHVPTPAWGVTAAAPHDELAVSIEPGVEEPHEAPAGRRPVWLGWLALLLAVATVVLHAVAVAIEAGRAHEAAALLAWVAIVASIGAVGVGVAAIALDRGRGVGIAAVVLGACANPWLLLQALTVLQG